MERGVEMRDLKENWSIGVTVCSVLLASPSSSSERCASKSSLLYDDSTFRFGQHSAAVLRKKPSMIVESPNMFYVV